jgi:hypothetical protein
VYCPTEATSCARAEQKGFCRFRRCQDLAGRSDTLFSDDGARIHETSASCPGASTTWASEPFIVILCRWRVDRQRQSCQGAVTEVTAQ